MPYLQLDVNGKFAPEAKKKLAAAMGETYARLMTVDIRRVSVAIRDFGDGGLWRICEGGGEPVPAAMLMLDIRCGRPPELREAVAKALSAHCVEILGVPAGSLNVTFTQHSGDEMYHPILGGFSREWQAEEE